MNIIKYITFILIFQMITSCIGVVKSKNSQSSISNSDTSSTSIINYSGLISATAVSSSKVELLFEPVNSYLPEDLVYEIYINNTSLPLKVSGNVLENYKAISGNYLYTISNLNINTSYSFNIRVVKKGAASTAVLDPNKALTATTFANVTADFNGVGSLNLGEGDRDIDTVVVKWPSAVITGTTLNTKESDPVAYEIIYWTGSLSKTTIQIPNSLATATLSTTTQYTVNNLLPSTTYYFQVRAIHKGYATNYLTNTAYKREKNNKVLSITTKASVNTDLRFGNTGLLYANNPIDQTGRSSINLTWDPAYGKSGLFTYTLAYKKINIGLGQFSVDQLTNINSATVVQGILPDKLSYKLTGLDPKSYYQFKIFACDSSIVGNLALACTASTNFVSKQILPPLAPFYGINSIVNPNDISHLSYITLKFNSPDKNYGYTNKLNIYCHDINDFTNKVLVPAGGTTTTAISSCNNISIISPSSYPADESSITSLTSFTLSLKQNANSIDKFCFSISDAINYDDLTTGLADDETASPVVKCITPSTLPPSLAEFSGRGNSCNISGSSMTITWSQPTGGLYSNFVVFYKAKASVSDVFSFTDATSGFDSVMTSSGTNNGYNYFVLDNVTYSKKISSLVEGQDYLVGVLSFYNDVATSKKVYSAFNTTTGACSFPAPTPTFNEWVDIFAIGPKEDGLLAGLEKSGVSSNLFESLDSDGTPVEVLSTDNNIATQYYSNGIARSNAGVFYKNSNTGIIKLSWKDITFTNGSSMYDYISSTSGTGLALGSRLYGYKVYRSEDNKLTWNDLTASGPAYPDSVAASPPTSRYTTTNRIQTPVAERIVTFTDYSVKSLGTMSGTNDTDVARVYWYKVVPYFNGRELNYTSGSNPNHHILKVTLPPKNMALIHRMMANRLLCLEMKKTINKAEGYYYSCSYNGLGASGISQPWQKGATVYDQGGDLLVDRYELGCAFTRGDDNGASIDSSVANNTSALNSKSFDSFKGCLNISQSAYEPYSSTSYSSESTGHKVKPGDCFGSDQVVKSYQGTSAGDCAARNASGIGTDFTAYYSQILFPGSTPDSSTLVPCANVSNVQKNDDFPFYPGIGGGYFNSVSTSTITQSEYAAVYYNRSGANADANYTRAVVYEGGLSLSDTINGYSKKYLTQSEDGSITGGARESSCKINLAYKVGGAYVPRWISINHLFGRLGVVTQNSAPNPDGSPSYNSPINKTIYNKTLNDLSSDSDFFDSSHVAPTSSRFDNNKSLIRLATSNSSKLPPIDGMSQNDLAETCSTYKVAVGVLKGTNQSNTVILSSAKNKRLVRRKESVVASAWPEAMPNGTSNSTAGTVLYHEAYSCNSINKSTSTGPSLYAADSVIDPRFPNANRSRPLYLSGSSSKDGSYHTEKCVSRFGIQDMIGNIAETNSEEIFCDYRTSQNSELYIGRYNGDIPAAGIDYTKSLPYVANTWYNSDPASPDNQNVSVLLKKNDNSLDGSCSVVDNRLNLISYLTGNSIKSIYKTDGTLNTSIVFTAKSQDQESINTLRNGDGSFLTFGNSNLAPALNTSGNIANSLASKSIFNPAIGIPLWCGANADCSTVNSDNAFSINNIPTTLSNIFSNQGTMDIATLTRNVTTSDSYSYINLWLILQNVANGILPDKTDPTFPVTNVAPSSGGYTEDKPAKISYSFWSMDRNYSDGSTGDTVRFYSGGNSENGVRSSRYALSMESSNETWEHNPTRRSGGRCAVMINDN